ncbi:hypothetical protein H0H87_002866 [Tephrocybe sp. NHM501043]|nr:hypothetical protein H0H87_002866 [Tephrocybe sp. NHM501043]
MPLITDTAPHHWKYVSEGGATIVFSYIGPPNLELDGFVLRLRKIALPTPPQAAITAGAQDEPDDPLIEFQQKCMERLILSEHLPHLLPVHVTRDWLESLVSVHDHERPQDRREKDQIDLARRKGVLATDLVGGDWLAVEIKPKWAFLPSPTHLSDTTRDVKSRTCRFCMHSAMKSKAGEAVSLGYCPLDLFSGNKDRVQKAIYNLWDAWRESNGSVNNLKIFFSGQKLFPSQATSILASEFNTEPSDSQLREDFAAALLPLLLETSVLHTISTLQRTLDSLDIEGLSKLWRLAESAQRRADGIDGSSYFSPVGAGSAYLAFNEPTITDWTEFLDVYLSPTTNLDHNKPTPDNLRFYLLAYLLSATFKDCSIIVRLDGIQTTRSAKAKPGQVTVIDLDPKSMARLRKWEELDQEIVEAYIVGDASALPFRRNASTYNTNVAGLNEEETEFRNAVVEFAQKEVAPRAAEIDKTNAFPAVSVALLRHFEPLKTVDLGNYRISGRSSVPWVYLYDGLSLGYFHHTLAMEALSAASGSVALSYGAHSNLCVNQIYRHGSDQQKAKYLPDLVNGKKVGSLAMSEVGSGSDVVSMRLKAEKIQGGWKLNGTKFWITNGPVASTLVVYAKTAPDLGSKGITAFIIERGFNGFSTSPKLDKFGMRGSDTCELVFNDCEVPDGNQQLPSGLF